MKKLLALILSTVMLLSMAIGFSSCSVSTDTGESKPSSEATAEDTNAQDTGAKPFDGVTIEVAERFTGATSDAFADIVAEFTAETGCEVLVTEYGDDYENTMKTRMASNTLPDVFETHGWSILRYKEYLLDLRDEPWVSELDEAALGVIQDEDGSIYVLMISQIVNGTLVNLEVCEAAGVDPYEITTWDEFTVAAQKIKDAGYIPIIAAAGPGNFANIAGTWVNYEGALSQDSEAMLNGTYDFQSFEPFFNLYSQWLDAGFFAQDYATMTGTDASERFAQNEGAFWLGNGIVFLAGANRLNPEGQYALLPTFASTEEGQMHFGVGEGETFGIWKDSENIDAAKAFLEFMARPENVVALTAISGNTPSLASAVEVAEGYGMDVYNTMRENYEGANILYENLWDRKYMPSGMWPIFGNALKMFIDDHSEAGTQATIDYLAENYLDLYEAAQMQ